MRSICSQSRGKGVIIRVYDLCVYRILGCQAASVDVETVPGGNILLRMSYSAIMAARKLPERSGEGFESW